MGIPTAAGRQILAVPQRGRVFMPAAWQGSPVGRDALPACLESMVGFSKAFFFSLFSSCCEFYYFLYWNWVQEHSQNPTRISQW